MKWELNAILSSLGFCPKKSSTGTNFEVMLRLRKKPFGRRSNQSTAGGYVYIDQFVRSDTTSSVFLSSTSALAVVCCGWTDVLKN